MRQRWAGFTLPRAGVVAALVCSLVVGTTLFGTTAVAAHPAEERPPASSGCATLGQGATGAAVKVVQRLVHTPADGQFGPGTAAKLGKWQRHHGLAATGEVDAATWATFPTSTARKACGRGVDGVGVSCPALGNGSTGIAVAVLQKALGVTVDGQFGPATASAVQTAQRQHGLSATGTTDVKTWRALGLEYTPACAELTKDEKAQLRIRARVTKLAAQLEQKPGTTSTTVGRRAYHFDRKQLGKPYKYGATGPKAYDCSGLQMTAYKHAGVTIPRVAAAQYADGGPRVSLADAQRGDLLFFASDVSKPSTVYHVAMYIGHGEILDAPYTGKDVEIAPLWTQDLLPHVVRPA